MDLNIGAALWLAAHAEGPVRLHVPLACATAARNHGPPAASMAGQGTCQQQQQAPACSASGATAAGRAAGGEAAAGVHWQGGRPYRSAARVVLLGHGADELCAGYGRHRTRFRKQARRFACFGCTAACACMPRNTCAAM